MTKETKNRLHSLYGIAVSAAAVVAGICFALSAYGLYTAGLAADTQPYTPQTIAAAFRQITIPVYLCLALILGGFVLNIFLPPEPRKPKTDKNRTHILEKLRTKTDLSACPADLRAAIEKQRRSRRSMAFVGGFLLVLCTLLFLAYACRAEVWHETDFNGSMIRGFFAMVICLTPPLLYHLGAAFALPRSLDKEIALMRQASTLAPCQGHPPSPAPKSHRLENIVRYSILLLALGLVTYGLCTGGTVDVLAKAATICTECVGLG